MARGPDALRELRRFDSAIRSAFRYPIGTHVTEPSALSAAVFSDSFVAAAPVVGGFPVPEADAVFHLVYEAANLQTALAMRGYFARGAITVGLLHFHDGLIFGPALVEAVDLERNIARNPRIVLSPNAALSLRRGQDADQLLGIGSNDAPVLVDADGLAFVNYLERIFEDTEADPADLIRSHRDRVLEQLTANSADLSRWSKHCWTAEYHNSICKTRGAVLAHHTDPAQLLIDAIHTERAFHPLL